MCDETQYTLESAKKICKNFRFELLEDKYINARTNMKVKDEYGYLYSLSLDNIKRNSKHYIISKNNPYNIYNFNLFLKNNCEGYVLLSDIVISSHEKIQVMCNKGHSYKTSYSKLRQGRRCPYCCNKKVLKGYNDIATTDSDITKYLKNKEDGYKYSRHSKFYVIAKCPNCGREKEVMVKNLCRSGLNCECSSKRCSYSEKIMVSILNQLNVSYLKEYQPDWSNNKRYDFYLLDYNYIIEMHGEQHYYENRSFEYKGGKSFKEEQENDKLKMKLALNNNISNYIVIDCRKSDLNWIKDNILKSDLKNVLNFDCINWYECATFAMNNNICKDICDYWNTKEEWETVKHVAKFFNLGKSSTTEYLKKGTELGWCVYNPKEEMRKNYTRFKNKSYK